MEGITKKSGIEELLKEGFSFADAKKVVDDNSIRLQLNTNMPNMGDKIDLSLVTIKTEPGCDTAPTPINFKHPQEDNSCETITAIKEEIDSDADDVDNNNVTVHLLIPDTVLAEKSGVIQANIEENLIRSVNSDIPSTQSVLSEAREQSNISSDLVSENTTSVFEPTDNQQRKRKATIDFITLESITSPTGVHEVIVEASESVKKRRDRGPMNEDEVVTIDHGSSMPSTSTTECNEQNAPQQPKKRGRKKKEKPKIKERVVCPFCDLQVVKTYFTNHVRIHTDEKPFKCQKCPYSSHFKRPLECHIESHHPTVGYIKPRE